MDFISEIKNRINIEDLVSKLGLKRGRKIKDGFFVKSIYKEEKTPSMAINVKKNSFHCYATGKGGDVIQLYQDFYGIETKTAVKELAEMAGLTNTNIQAERAPVKQKIKRWDMIYADLHKCLSQTETEIFKKEFDNYFGTAKNELYEDTLAIRSLFEKDLNKILKPVRLHRLEKNKKIFRELHNYCNSLLHDEPFFSYLVEQRKLNFRSIIKHKIFFIIDYKKVNEHLKNKFALPDLQRAGLYNEKGNLIFYNHRIIIQYLWNDQIVYLRARYFDKKNNANPENGISKYIGLSNDALNLNRSKRFYNSDIINLLLPG